MNMLGKLAVVFVVLMAPLAASADLISITSTSTEFAPGSLANLQGLEWLSLDETTNQSVDTFLGGFGGLVDDGWRLASLGETQTLVGSLWDGVYDGYSAGNAAGAGWFIDVFGALNTGQNSAFYGISESNFTFGTLGDCGDNSRPYCSGSIRYSLESRENTQALNVLTGDHEITTVPGSGPYGAIIDGRGIDMGLGIQNLDIPSSGSGPNRGLLLVRQGSGGPIVSIPEPSTLALLGIGLLGIGLVRRRRKV